MAVCTRCKLKPPGYSPVIRDCRKKAVLSQAQRPGNGAFRRTLFIVDDIDPESSFGEQMGFYLFVLWWIVVLTIAACLFWRRRRGGDYFNEIKKIVESQSTDSSNVNRAISELNTLGRGEFLVEDYVDIRFDGNQYKLARCTFTSVGSSGENIGTWVERSNYLISLDGAATEYAKGKNDLFKLWAQNESVAIFIIKDMKGLKGRIEAELRVKG
jgi:hypothetical protein